jgi:hypothetical protein
VLSKASKLNAALHPSLAAARAPGRRVSVSICTVVLVSGFFFLGVLSVRQAR